MSIGQYLLGGAAGLAFGLLVAAGNTLLPVSYTHLDVYKRQRHWRAGRQRKLPAFFLPKRARKKPDFIRGGPCPLGLPCGSKASRTATPVVRRVPAPRPLAPLCKGSCQSSG